MSYQRQIPSAFIVAIPLRNITHPVTDVVKMSRPDNEPTDEQKLVSLNNKAHDIADTLEEMLDWDGAWEPSGEETREFELRDDEIKAIRRGLRRKASSHFRNRGFCLSYMKYRFLYQKFGGDELTWHTDDPKFKKMQREREE